MNRIISLILASLLFCALSYAVEIKIPADYPTIQAGIDASIPGDIVIVSPGVFRGNGNRDIDFGGKFITLRSEAGPLATIIDCDGSESNHHRGFYFHSNESGDAIVEGFTIRNGYESNGGAVYCYQSDPEFRNCIFFNNATADKGGAVLLWTSNSAFIDCVFDNNSGESGAAIHVTSSSNPLFMWCEFKYGQSYYGGAIVCNGTGHTQLYNSLFFSNTASAGSAIYIANDASIYIGNCTMTDNAASYGAIHMYNVSVSIKDSILWNNTPKEIEVQSGSQPTITFSDIQQETGVFPGDGNLNTDPLFINPLVQQYQLSHISAGQAATSPNINAGSADASSVCYPYIQGTLCMNTLTTQTNFQADTGIVDLGFHYPKKEVPTPTPTAQPTSGPTPTPDPCSVTGVTLWMPGTLYSPGNVCRCSATVCNATGAVLNNHPLLVVLDIMGTYFFAPGFTEFDTFLELYPSFVPGNTIVEVLPVFYWPSGAGTLSGVYFYAALTNPEITSLFGEMDQWEFGWTE